MCVWGVCVCMCGVCACVCGKGNGDIHTTVDLSHGSYFIHRLDSEVTVLCVFPSPVGRGGNPYIDY